MPLGYKGLLFKTKVTGTLSKELSSEMSVNIILAFLYVSTIREAETREGIPKSSSSRKKTILAKGFPASRELYSVGVRLCCLLG